VPVCLYALLQPLGLDPLARDSPIRAGSALGNSIFLAAYLGCVLFLSLALLYEVARSEPRNTLSGLRRGMIAAGCGLQLGTLIATSSRGPILGAAAGLGLLGTLVWASASRRQGPARTGAPGPGGRVALVFIVVIIGAAIPTLRAQRYDRVQTEKQGVLERQSWSSRRISRLVDTATPTARVRLWLWQTATDAFLSSQPLPSASGADDLHPWRRLVGYGAATARYPLAFHERPELRKLDIGRAPDNAHNALLHALIGGGVVGLAGEFLLFVFVPLLAATRVGGIRSRRGFRTLAAWVVTGAAAGGVVCGLLWGSAALAAPGSVAGGLAAMALGLTLARWRHEPDSGPSLLTIILLSAWASQIVERQFGVVVTTTLVLAWLTLAVFVVVASGWLDEGNDETARPEAFGSGVAVAMALLPVVVAFVFGVARHDAPGLAWSGLPHQRAMLWLVCGTGVLGLALVEDTRGVRGMILGGIGGLVGYRFVLWGLPTLDTVGWVRAWKSVDIAVAMQREAWLVAILLVWIVVATLAWGWQLALTESRSGRQPDSLRRRVSVHGVLWACTAVIALAGVHETRVVESALFTHGARAAARQRRFDAALAMLERARARRPREARLALWEGRIAFDWANVAADEVVRETALARAKTALDDAVTLAPYDADHVANLARWHVARARFARDQTERRRQLESAIQRFERAVQMWPNADEWKQELASARRRVDRTAPEPAF
jgi:hypothetical protein